MRKVILRFQIEQVRKPISWAGYLLSLPAALLLLALFLLPAASVVFISMTNWQFGADDLSFIGGQNFLSLFFDHDFRTSLWNTLSYVLIVVPSTFFIGLTIAIAIEAGSSLRTFYRAIHFLPFMATLAAMALAWEALLHPTIGLINQILTALHLPTENWLRDERTVLPVLAAIGIWQNLGFAMILFLAGLKAIPQELYDAAEIDGADSWFDRLTTVTLPLLGPVSMFILITVAVRAFEAFDTVQILTQGGPGRSSDMLLYSLYRESFRYLNTGYGAAITVVFLVIIVGLTLFQARLFERRIHYT
nr:sugar ABC transporter permease [Mesorhizobium sp. WSM3224]